MQENHARKLYKQGAEQRIDRDHDSAEEIIWCWCETRQVASDVEQQVGPVEEWIAPTEEQSRVVCGGGARVISYDCCGQQRLPTRLSSGTSHGQGAFGRQMENRCHRRRYGSCTWSWSRMGGLWWYRGMVGVSLGMVRANGEKEEAEGTFTMHHN